MKNIGIIGAGASGIMAAIQAADNGACVTLFERKDNIGKKLLVTGNGRCNFTNVKMSGEYYYCDDQPFLDECFKRFGNYDLVSFFMRLGLLIKEKNGYVYPACEQASSVVDVLKIALKHDKIKILTNTSITKIIPDNNGFKCISEDNTEYLFDSVILSSGGRSSLTKWERANGYDILHSLGIKYTRLFPALTQVKCDGFNFREISGVRQDCSLSVYVDDELKMKQSGEVLFTDTGISGIVTFQISHLAAMSVYEGRNITVSLDFFEDLSVNSLLDFVTAKLLVYPDVTLEEFFTGFLNKKLNNELIRFSGLNPATSVKDVPKDQLLDVFRCMKSLSLKITGTGDFDKSQVTGGGVSLSDLTENFEVKSVPNLFITGELLDVDGLCGGYNLQWAFTSGYIAGVSAATIK